MIHSISWHIAIFSSSPTIPDYFPTLDEKDGREGGERGGEGRESESGAPDRGGRRVALLLLPGAGANQECRGGPSQQGT